MNRFKIEEIKSKGCSGLVIRFEETENIDLLNLIEMKPQKYPFFLESSSRGNALNRYSIIFYNPKVVLKKEKKNINYLNEFNKLWKSI